MSAIARNKARLDEYEVKRLTVSVGRFNGQEVLFCCPSAWDTLSQSIAKQGSGAAEC